MVVICNWEGNRRFGVAPVMRHSLVVYPSTYELSGLENGDEHPIYAAVGVYGTFYNYFFTDI